MRIDIQFGIIAGFATILCFTLEFVLGFHTTYLNIGKYTSYLSALIPVITVYMAIKRHYTREEETFLTWRQGLQFDTVIFFTGLLIFTIFFIIYCYFINPDWKNFLQKLTEQEIILSDMSEEQIEIRFHEFTEILYNPSQIWFRYIIGYFLGFLISLIVILFLIKSNKFGLKRN